MKTRIIIAMLMLYSTGVFAQQTNGAINGKTENGIRKEVSVDSFTANRFAFMVKDSTLNALFAAKDSTKDRFLVGVQNMYAVLAADSVKYRSTIAVSNMYSVSAADSTKYRYLIGVANMYSVLAADSVKYRGTVQVSNTVAISAASLPLPTGAATSANQSTEIASLGLLDDVVNTDGGVTGGRGLLIIGSDGANARNVKTNTAGNIETKAWSVDSANFAGINTKLGGTLTVNNTNQANSGVDIGDVTINNASGGGAVNVQDGGNSLTVDLDSSLQRKGVVIIGGSITATAGATAIFDSTYAAVTMDTTGLGAKANSATVGWQSDSVGLRQHKVTDVKIGISLDMASGAPANDKAVYVYVYPLWYDGSAMNFTDGGTGTLPSGANSTYTIATPNDLTLLGVLSYTTSDMVVSRQFMLSSVYTTMPDGFGIIIVNYSGVALAASTHKVVYSLVTKVQR